MRKVLLVPAMRRNPAQISLMRRRRMCNWPAPNRSASYRRPPCRMPLTRMALFGNPPHGALML
jgi:hypothetical protein